MKCFWGVILIICLGVGNPVLFTMHLFAFDIDIAYR